MIPAMVRGKYFIRFCLTYEHAKQEHIGREIYVNIFILQHIDNAWAMIQEAATYVLKNLSFSVGQRRAKPLRTQWDRRSSN